ncbi:MAG: hypothetical protein CVU05_00025 [Bacteroidetes bacterium HGW-Bacteroidetes-21]|nr:MAG: hypothetical protein CVU05_00025 [Bacteroidetes bacterium HGW-Bacteroidetes-21]
MYIAAFTTITLATLGIMTNLYTDYLFPIPGHYYSIFFGALFFLYLFYRSNLKYSYFAFSEEGNKLVLRYYRMGTINVKFRSIEIPKNTLHSWEIKKHFFNKRSELILFQSTPKGIAKYPPVPITALTKQQSDAVMQTLAMYARKVEN